MAAVPAASAAKTSPTPYPAVSSLQLERNQTNVTMPKTQPGSCPHVTCGDKPESCSPVYPPVQPCNSQKAINTRHAGR